VCMALKTLRCCGISSLLEQRSTLRAIHTLNSPKKYIRKLRGLAPIHLMCRCKAQGLMWGARGPLPPVVAMVVAVVMQLCFVLTVLKNAIKTLKLVVCLSRILLGDITISP
jgi:hypothetical protein